MMYIKARYNPTLFPGRDNNQPVIFDPSFQDSEDHSAASAKLTMELGKAGSLELVIPYNHAFYNELSNNDFVYVDVWKDDKILWRGRPLSLKKDFYGNLTVSFEGALTFLNDINLQSAIIRTRFDTAFKTAMDRYVSNCSEFRRIWFGSFESINRGYPVEEVTLDQAVTTSCFDYLSSSVNKYGGYMDVRFTGENPYIHYFDFATSHANTQLVEMGVNLLSISTDYDITKLPSAYLGYGSSYRSGVWPDMEEKQRQLYINGVGYNKTNSYIINQDLLARYGRVEKNENFSYIDYINSDVSTGSEQYGHGLDSKVPEAYAALLDSAFSIDIKAMDLSLIGENVESFNIGDRIRVISKLHGVDDYYLCSKIIFDLLHPEKSEYYMGGSALAATSLSAMQASAIAQQALATKGITGTGVAPVVATLRSSPNATTETLITRINELEERMAKLESANKEEA